MPKFGAEQGTPITGSFGFSSVDLNSLGATEYTVVGVTVDCSTSVRPFQKQEEAALGQIVLACRKSGRADNLLYRLTRFNDTITEVHGFKLLRDCNPLDYDGAIPAAGWTAVYDASVNIIDSLRQQGQQLSALDFDVNGIAFVISDGEDNKSRNQRPDVKRVGDDAVGEGKLESLIRILIGVNVQNPTLDNYLTQFAIEGGFTPIQRTDQHGKPMYDSQGDPIMDPYLKLEDATESTLAKLAAFVSRSISSQSQSVGSGAAAQPTF